jgi:uncharacterized protein
MGNKLQSMASQFATVVITGGSSGIGKAFVHQLHSLNRSIFFCNLSRSKPCFETDDIAYKHFPCHLGERGAIESVFREVVREMPPGRILLINNSGFGSYGPFPEPALEDQLEMIDVNVRALVELTGRFLPLLRERGGAVVNVASTAAFQPTPYMATYGSGKAFVLHWSLALERDLQGTGVRVLALCPGPTATDFFLRAGFKERVVSPGLSQTPDEVVIAALKALARGKRLCVPGWKNRVLTALSPHLPKPLAATLGAAILRRVRLAQLRAMKRE